MSLKSKHLSKEAHDTLLRLAIRKNPEAKKQNTWLLEYQGIVGCAICGSCLDLGQYEDDEHGIFHLKQNGILVFI